MRLSTITDFSQNKMSLEECIQLIKNAGFDCFDISLSTHMYYPDSPFNQPDYLEYTHKLRKHADLLGITCNQAHAPCPTSRGDEETDEKIFREVVRSMEIASIMGANIIVVHPKQHLCYAEHAEELFHMNVEFYNRLIPYCEKYNIKVATENMWQSNMASLAITDSTCSRAWEFCKYVDAVGSDWIVGCLDIGHASLTGTDIPAFIHALGNKRLQALHVHDTDLVHDTHTIPFMEKIDYMAVAKALGEIDYQGDFTYEADNFYANKPAALFPATAKYMHEVGRFLISEVEAHRK